MYNIVFVWNQRQAAANELVGAFKHQIRDALKHRISHVTWSHWVFFGGGGLFNIRHFYPRDPARFDQTPTRVPCSIAPRLTRSDP